MTARSTCFLLDRFLQCAVAIGITVFANVVLGAEVGTIAPPPAELELDSFCPQHISAHGYTGELRVMEPCVRRLAEKSSSRHLRQFAGWMNESHTERDGQSTQPIEDCGSPMAFSVVGGLAAPG